MKYLRNFLIATLIVFIGVSIGTSALSEHTPDTRDIWLMTIDYDKEGNPRIERLWEPKSYETVYQCMLDGNRLLAMIEKYQPARRYAMMCAVPDDEDNVDALVKQLSEEFRSFFTPPSTGA